LRIAFPFCDPHDPLRLWFPFLRETLGHRPRMPHAVGVPKRRPLQSPLPSLTCQHLWVSPSSATVTRATV
jgi:hypothetical protein